MADPTELPDPRKTIRTDQMICVRIDGNVHRADDSESGFAVSDTTWEYYFESPYGEAEISANTNRFRIGEVVLVKHAVGEIAYFRDDEALMVDGIPVNPVEYKAQELVED